ncbi:uncharacterized protein [Amphiura filiformis]|uniref:uncharacterized protein n=1 Tax=Amphiura filiformis TaxID=82378 RepID=UPI003B228F6A
MTGAENLYDREGARRRKSEKRVTGGVKQHKHRHKLKHRFQFIKTLGRGTYGKVKLATEIETGEQVAIKSIPKSKIENADDLRRIRQEIQIMSALDHPHIISIKEVFESKEKIVLVMEYASGGELYDYINSDKLTAEEARRFFQQVASAVHYCHKNNIVHRDLKLENLLLDENHNVKIADFGLSSVFDHNNLLYTYCGSPLYASPEIVNGLPYHGPEVDCWSLGVVLYAMTYKTMPFLGGDFNELRQQISEGDYYEPSNPSDASDLIHWMLRVDPKRRANIEDIYHHPWVCGDTLDVPPPEVRGTRVLPMSSRLQQQLSSDTDGLSSDSDVEVNYRHKKTKQPKSILKNNCKHRADKTSTEASGVTESSVVDHHTPAAISTEDDNRKHESANIDQTRHSSAKPKRSILKQTRKHSGTDSGLDINETGHDINVDLLTVESLEKEFGILTTSNKRDSGFDQDFALLGAQASGFQELADELEKKTSELSAKIGESDLNGISKRHSKGKYSVVMEMWESIYCASNLNNDDEDDAILKEEPSSPSSGNSSASSSEDLLDILDTDEFKTKAESRHKSGHRVTYRMFETNEITTVSSKDGKVHTRLQGHRSTSDTLLGMEDEMRDVLRRALKISESLM